MSPISKCFVRASMVYFCIAAILGATMVYWAPPRPAHLIYIHGHIMLLGWMSMMVFGVGYHILPRFCGNPVAYPGLSYVHFYLSNVALVGLVCSFPVIRQTRLPMKVFAVMMVISVFMFVVNIWVSMITQQED